MTAKEAIELLDAIARRNVFCTLEEEQLSAFELAHIALEKQIPKKPELDSIIGSDFPLRYCPSCGIRLRRYGSNYCGKCGQALYWAEMEAA